MSKYLVWSACFSLSMYYKHSVNLDELVIIKHHAGLLLCCRLSFLRLFFIVFCNTRTAPVSKPKPSNTKQPLSTEPQFRAQLVCMCVKHLIQPVLLVILFIFQTEWLPGGEPQ